MLRLSAPEPLPDELRARLRQHKAEIVALLSAAEPANDVAPEVRPCQSVAGLPREIADGVHAILSADGAQGIPPQRWPRVQRDAARLVEGGWLHSRRSRSAGPRPTCSAATAARRGTGSTGPGSSC